MLQNFEIWKVWISQQATNENIPALFHPLLICLTLDVVVYYIQTIDQVMIVEKDFFAPYIAGFLGNSLESAQELQSKLEVFEPTAKVEKDIRALACCHGDAIESRISSNRKYF